MTTRLILTCEHAGNRLPAAYRKLFRGAADVLASHRGWDPGALQLAKALERRLSAPLFFSTVTRLLVELNRSLGHRRLFSEFTAGLDKSAKQEILKQYYFPYRSQVESWIARQIEKRSDVVHLSLHTFTPVLNGEVRSADVGFLYDPQSQTEKLLCKNWRAALRSTRPDLRLRRNYPYLGKADGFIPYLRRQFPHGYAGIELEVNQAWPTTGKSDWRRLQQNLVESFSAIVEDPSNAPDVT